MTQADILAPAAHSDDDSRARSAVAAATAVVGAALFSWGVRRGNRGGTLAKVAGAVLLGESVRRPLTLRVAAKLDERRKVELKTSLVIERPVHDVFEFLHDFENLPRVIHRLEHVADFQNGRSRWTARGHDGSPLAWDVIITKYVPNTVIGWSSVPGSSIKMTGNVRFRPLSSARTQLDIWVQYVRRESTVRLAMEEVRHRAVQQELREELDRLPAYIASLPLAPSEASPIA